MKRFGGNIQFPGANNYIQSRFDLNMKTIKKNMPMIVQNYLLLLMYLGPQIIKTTKEIVLEINVCLIKNS